MYGSKVLILTDDQWNSLSLRTIVVRRSQDVSRNVYK